MVQIRQFWIELRHLGMPLVYEVIVQFTGGHFEACPKIIYMRTAHVQHTFMNKTRNWATYV